MTNRRLFTDQGVYEMAMWDKDGGGGGGAGNGNQGGLLKQPDRNLAKT